MLIFGFFNHSVTQSSMYFNANNKLLYKGLDLDGDFVFPRAGDFSQWRAVPELFEGDQEEGRRCGGREEGDSD